MSDFVSERAAAVVPGAIAGCGRPAVEAVDLLVLAVPGRAGTLLVGLRWLTGPVPAIMLVVEPVACLRVGR